MQIFILFFIYMYQENSFSQLKQAIENIKIERNDVHQSLLKDQEDF